MRVSSLAFAAAIVLAACGGAAQPAATNAPATATPTTAPTVAATAAPTATPATKLTFTADLKPESEVPPVPNDEKVGTGKATVTFDLTRDATGKITAAKASANFTLTAFPVTTAILLAHIHGPDAPAGVVASPKFGFKTDSDNPILLTTGGTTYSKADVTITDVELLQKMIDDPSKFYFNVHSKLNPGGVARGQMTKG